MGHGVSCPECGKGCTMADHAPERTWRHLDTMQFETLIRARVPRSRCPEHGVKTVGVSWAEPGSRFTLLVERFALAVMVAARSLTQACDLLGLDWDVVRRIMVRAVQRGLKRREPGGLVHAGIDEKSFRSGQSCDLGMHLTQVERATMTEVRFQGKWGEVGAFEARHGQSCACTGFFLPKSYLRAPLDTSDLRPPDGVMH